MFWSLGRNSPMLKKYPRSVNPPFPFEYSLVDFEDIKRPTSIRRNGRLVLRVDDADAYLGVELQTPRLDRVFDHLWLAGLPRPARPLHRQKLLGRTILVTENPNEHLVWYESKIFVKPVPEVLLSYQGWEEGLCDDESLYRSACGMLLSYTWLVAHHSDFRIAKDLGLLPAKIQWPEWTRFVERFLGGTDEPHRISKRYEYGELRLSRLHLLYKFLPSMISARNLVYGYMSHSTWNRAFLHRHFAWLLACFAYMSVVLSAIQTGLATDGLQASSAFQTASLVFVVVSVVGIMVIPGILATVWLVLVCHNVFSTRQYVKNLRKRTTNAMG